MRQQVGRCLDELLPSVYDTSCHPYGNYVLQQLMAVGGARHKLRLCGALSGRIRELSFDPYGCRVVQKLLEVSVCVRVCVCVCVCVCVMCAYVCVIQRNNKTKPAQAAPGLLNGYLPNTEQRVCVCVCVCLCCCVCVCVPGFAACVCPVVQCVLSLSSL